ncbi:hypothetical protein BDD12DRAFT_812322 [Trichophaea hybrida]|nr:hypothetical protein BDD12DRAFT_812322 [Trichophaea hybrida]
MTPTFHAIHPARFNEHDPRQHQVFLTLSDPASTYLPCPGYLPGTDSLFFLTPALGKNSTLHIEVLAKMEAEELITRTGRVVGEEMVQEYRVLIPIGNLAKKCGGCGRWEALVKRRGIQEEGMPKDTYRRWQTCGGCGLAWFCNKRCLQVAWDRGHWRSCVRMRGLRDAQLAIRDFEGQW